MNRCWKRCRWSPTTTSGRATRQRACRATCAVLVLGLALGVLPVVPATQGAAQAPVGQGFNLNASDLRFILRQIKIAERHAATATATNPCGTLLGSDPDQIPNVGNSVELPWGLRTVDGSCNNLIEGQSHFGAADQLFPRLVPAAFREAEPSPFGPPGPATSYAQTSGSVFDSEPRVISNLIVDQTAANPAAVAAAGEAPEVTPSGAFLIPNVAPDAGLSAPYNSWFTLFGQFFDHGLDLVKKGGAGTVFVPLKADDPLFDVGPDGIAHTGDDGPNFMVLTRATHGGDHEAVNQTSPFVDQSQTYSSHPSHQVFLRQYDNATGVPLATGRLLTGPGDGMATWDDVQLQARDLLGIELADSDALSVPLIATDPYGRFLRGPNGYPQLVVPADPDGLVEGDPNAPVSTAGATPSGHAFLDDIAHHAAPGPVDHDGNPATPRVPATPDGDPGTADDGNPLTYDDEMLGAHFMAGDGRINENIGLVAVHHVFHAEHNRLTEHIKDIISTEDPTMVPEWQLEPGAWNGERIFQAARFVTEMEYQHLAFEEFARKVQPMVNPFGGGGTGYRTTIDPAIRAEFAHAVYRFGHSMLNESVDRIRADGTRDDISLLDAFLNPPRFFDGAIDARQAAGNIVRGMTRQVGNELDEFVTEALRNQLLGLPLDLATLNLTRARDTGIPGLNAARRSFHAATGNSALAPYESWTDLGFNLKHRESLVNFVAAYGTHPTIAGAGTVAARRAAAALLVAADPANPATPADAFAFMNSTDAWAPTGGVTTTGVDDIDLWVGGLAEKQMVFGGLLGPTFNFVFERQMEDLQDGDRFYYLSRTAGLNLLTQLEGNSFAELIQRNTDVSGLPADSFSRPDFVFDVSKLGTSGPVLDDPATAWNESELLVRMANGTIRYTGQAHVVFNGNDAADDRIHSSEGDDTIRGNGGNDWIQGGDGNDNLIGGLGDDILTDLGGDDTLKGGDGDDVLSSGQGFGGDLNQGGRGNDFVIGGNDATETFAGPGDDFVYAGDGDDTVFGDDGNDWIEGGGGAFNLLQGDNGAPFQDDPNEPGHDVLIGYGGEMDYDAEGGDDIMLAGPGIQRNEGMLGFDWVTHATDPQNAPADSDMSFTGFLPPAVETNRDRFDLVEALSGWERNDVLRGDDRDAADMIGHELDAAGIARIGNLATLLAAAANSFTGGNIILGGAGSDTIEGRGGDDIIDGDAWLNVRIVVRDAGGNEIRSVTRMSDLRADALSGALDPGNLGIVREILVAPAAGDVDTVVFSGLLDEYTVTDNGDGTTTVAHVGGPADNGIDILRNIERLQFVDPVTGASELVSLVNLPGQNPPVGTVTLSTDSPVEDQPIVATADIQDADLIASPITFEWQAETTPGDWTAVAGGEDGTLTPDDSLVGLRLRAVARYTDGDGTLESVTSAPTATPVANVNDAPTGAAVIDDVTPQEAVAATVDVSGIADGDGLPATLDIRWQSSPNNGAFTDIPGATGATFTPGQAEVGRTLRVVVSYTDLHGTAEQVTSAPTGVVGDLFIGTAGNDTWTGTAGDDRAFGGAGADRLRGLGGNDVLSGDAGNDTLEGGAGDDVIAYTGVVAGFDTVAGGAGVDLIEATGTGTQITLASLAGVEQISGDGSARIVGSAAGNTFNFGAVTLSGILEVDGAGGNDNLTGSTSSDTLRGSAGQDTVGGGAGDDVIDGGAAADTLSGGAGNDRLVGGAGNDAMNGNGDNDVFAFEDGFGADTIAGFDTNPAGGQDLLDISALGITSATFAGSVTIGPAPGGGTRVRIGASSVTLTGVAPASVNADDFVLAG